MFSKVVLLLNNFVVVTENSVMCIYTSRFWSCLVFLVFVECLNNVVIISFFNDVFM